MTGYMCTCLCNCDPDQDTELSHHSRKSPIPLLSPKWQPWCSTYLTLLPPVSIDPISVILTIPYLLLTPESLFPALTSENNIFQLPSGHTHQDIL